MYGYIYITTNLINNKRYIGQKKSTEFLAEKYLGSGQSLIKAVGKYGRENFKVELIEECNSEDILNEKEIYWINFYDAVKSRDFYNKKEGGRGFSSSDISKWQRGSKRSEETRKRISESKIGDRNPMYGKHHSEEAKEKLSKANSGKNHWNYGNRGSSTFGGHKHSEESKEKIRQSLLGRKRGPYKKRVQ